MKIKKIHNHKHILYLMKHSFVSPRTVSSEKAIYPPWATLTTIFSLNPCQSSSEVSFSITICSLLLLLRGGRSHLAEQAQCLSPHACHFVGLIDLCEWTLFSSCPVKESAKPLSSNHSSVAGTEKPRPSPSLFAALTILIRPAFSGTV